MGRTEPAGNVPANWSSLPGGLGGAGMFLPKPWPGRGGVGRGTGGGAALAGPAFVPPTVLTEPSLEPNSLPTDCQNCQNRILLVLPVLGSDAPLPLSG